MLEFDTFNSTFSIRVVGGCTVSDHVPCKI